MSAPLVDVWVKGSWGLYEILSATRKGHAWVRKHLGGKDRTVLANGAVMCEGGDRIRAIVAGMTKDGLRVDVNGVAFTRPEEVSP